MSPGRDDLVNALFKSTAGLTRRLSIEEAESLFAVRLEELGPDPVPFGFLNPEWSRLKAKMRRGDELWEFEIKFPRGGFCRGVKLVRKGKLIDSIGAEAKAASDQRTAVPRRKKKRKSS